MKAGEPFAAGNEYHSVLYEEGEDGFRRFDLCSKCWQECDQKQILEGSCTHWVSLVPTQLVEEDSHRNRNEKALELLREGLEDGPPVRNMLLAMLLKRKKFLTYKQELIKEDGGVYHLYEVPSDEEIIAVPQVSISEEDVEAIQQQIMQELQ